MGKNKIEPISEVCPNCIEPLVLEKRKLGLDIKRNWFVCPKCGYRERPTNAGIRLQEAGNFIDNVRRKNVRNINAKYSEKE